MGIDISTCNNCEREYVQGYDVACGCGRNYCSKQCAKSSGMRYDEEADETTCKFCRGEDYNDSTLFHFILKECGITRQQVIDKYNEINKNA